MTECPSSSLGAKQTYEKTKSWWRSSGHRARMPSHISRYEANKLTRISTFSHTICILYLRQATRRFDQIVGIKHWQGEEARRKLDAVLYVECSAKYRENVDDLFREATKRALMETREPEQVRQCVSVCALLWCMLVTDWLKWHQCPQTFPVWFYLWLYHLYSACMTLYS